MYTYITCKGSRLIIPTTFDECLTYGQKQEYMWKVITELTEDIKTLNDNAISQINSLNDRLNTVETKTDTIFRATIDLSNPDSLANQIKDLKTRVSALENNT